MPAAIVIGDRIKLDDEHARPYRTMYNLPVDASWVVTGQSFVAGRRRLHVSNVPGMIWAGDARAIYGWQSKDRREHFAAMGIQAPKVST